MNKDELPPLGQVDIMTYAHFRGYLQELFMRARWGKTQQIGYLKGLYYDDPGNYHWKTLQEHASRLLEEEYGESVVPFDPE